MCAGSQMPPSKVVKGKGLPNLEYLHNSDMSSRVRKILTKEGYSGVSDEELFDAISKWKQMRLETHDNTELKVKEVAQQIANLVLELYKAAAAFNSSDDENPTAMSTGRQNLKSFDVISRRNESNLYFV